MPITDHIIEAGDYQQQGILISELNPQPTDMSAEELQARFDALGLLIKDKHNALITDLVNAFTAAGIANGALAESDNALATTVAGQLAYLLYRINHTGEGSGILPPVDSVTDAYLSGLTGNIKHRFADHTTAASPQHTAAQLPTGTTADKVALGNHIHNYAPTIHTHAAADIASGALDIARIPTGTTSTSVSKGDHTHDDRYYTETETASLLTGKANSTHGHAGEEVTSGTVTEARIATLGISKISGLQGALDSKVPIGNTYVKSDWNQDTGMYWDGGQMVVRVNSSAWGVSFNGHNHDGRYANASHGHGLNDSGIYYSTGDPGEVSGRVWLKPIT